MWTFLEAERALGIVWKISIAPNEWILLGRRPPFAVLRAAFAARRPPIVPSLRVERTTGRGHWGHWGDSLFRYSQSVVA